MLLLLFSIQFSSVQSLSRVRLFATPWTTACQASLSITNSQSPPKPIKSCSTLWSYELQHGRPLCPSSSARPCPSPCPLNRWRHPAISSSVSLFFCLPSFPTSGSFPMSCLAIQGTLKSLLQHHSLKASVLWCSAFFMVSLTSIHDFWKYHSFD